MLAFSVVIDPLYPIYLCIAFSGMIVTLVLWTKGESKKKAAETDVSRQA